MRISDWSSDVCSSDLIAGAARTPVGSFNGSLSSLAASQLCALAIKEALKRAQVQAAEVDAAILGQILTAGQGQNPARPPAVDAGFPYRPPAHQLHQHCGSGLRPVALRAPPTRPRDPPPLVSGAH